MTLGRTHSSSKSVLPSFQQTVGQWRAAALLLWKSCKCGLMTFYKDPEAAPAKQQLQNVSGGSTFTVSLHVSLSSAHTTQQRTDCLRLQWWTTARLSHPSTISSSVFAAACRLAVKWPWLRWTQWYRAVRPTEWERVQEKMAMALWWGKKKINDCVCSSYGAKFHSTADVWFLTVASFSSTL